MREVHGGAANYYKEVKVCGVCAQVYSLLDQSRELVVREEEKKMEEDKVKSLSDYTDHRDYKVGKDHKAHGHHRRETAIIGAEGEVSVNKSRSRDLTKRQIYPNLRTAPRATRRATWEL